MAVTTFKPRTTKPTTNNKYYIRKANGGYSDAIAGSPTDKECNVLSNCVGYAYGRFNEIGGYGACKYLAPVNAENFIQYKGSLEVGQKAKLGACMVWRKGATLSGSDGAGHVAIVEKIISDTEIVTSESAWGGPAFYTKTRKKGNGDWGMGSAYTFLGFIYNPAECCKETPKPEKIAYTLVTDIKGYNSSADAKARKNAKTTLKKGTYYMYYKYPKGYNGMYNITKNPETPGSWINPSDNVVTTKKSVLGINSVVSIKKGATYYNSSKIVPDWVLAKKWIVKSLSGNRVVIDKSTDGKSAICSPIHSKYLIVE